MYRKIVGMEQRKRLYNTILSAHLSNERQMAFITGPRQVGKTTVCRNAAGTYLNWDNTDDRLNITKGPAKIAEIIGLDRLQADMPVVLFDELHKFNRWKQLLKGFFDTYGKHVQILVTGSSRMDIYRRGGDSLMGRYFLYHIHPFTVAEVISQQMPDSEQIIRRPAPVNDNDFDALWTYGGYPEPFIKRNAQFSRRWQNLRLHQLIKEEVRDLTQINQLDQVEILVNILSARSGQQLIYSNLATQIQVSVDTVKRWVGTLCNMHLGFLVRPWFKNVSRSLRKEPKWFLRDWSCVADTGAKAETFIACHLLKAVEGWNDMGLGSFQLGYVRNKNQQEVDFIVIRNGSPWFLVEVKQSSSQISKSLACFQQQTNAPFAFQVVIDADYVDKDCFTAPGKALAVPAKTFLSQLL